MLHGLSFDLFDLIVGDDFMGRTTHFGVVRATVTGRLHVPLDGSRSSLGQIFVQRTELHNEGIDAPVLTNSAEIIKPANKTSCDDKAGQEESILQDDRGTVD